MLKRLTWAISVALLSILVFNVGVFAAWTLKFPTNVTDTSGSTRTYVPVLLGYGGQTLVDMGKISSNGTNTNMQIGTSNIKYMMATGNVTCVLPNLPATGIVTADLYTGYSPEQTAFAIITGTNGYITITDGATLELGNNFELEFDAYVYDDTQQVFINKPAALRCFSNGSGNVTVYIYASATTTAYLYPNAAGDYTNIPSATGVHWEQVDEPAGAPNDADWVADNNNDSTEQLDAYNLTTLTLLDGETINDVGVFGRGNSIPIGGHMRRGLRLAGAETLLAEDVLPNFPLGDFSSSVSRPGGGSWSSTDLASLQSILGLRDNGVGSSCAATQTYVYVDYYPVAITLSSVVTEGEHVVKVTCDTVNYELIVDNVTLSTVAVGGISVRNTGNDWVVSPSPYFDYYKHTVGGALVAWYEPTVMLSGTTLPDRQGAAENGAITWGSNSNISLSYGEMESYVDYIATVNATGGFDFPSASLPSTWFASGGNVTALPFYDAFSSVSAQTGQPVQMLYGLGIIGLAFGAFLLLIMFTRSALIAYIAMVMVFGIGASMTIIPAWIVFVLILVGAGIMYLYRQVAY
jgi:hypothetical protein